MLLAIDVGNTSIAIGVFAVARGVARRPVLKVWRIPSRPGSPGAARRKILQHLRRSRLSPRAVSGAVLSSVVPSLNKPILRMIRGTFRAPVLRVGPRTPCGVKNRYRRPAEVGADRIVNAAAAYERVGGPCLGVDFGTATTIDCVNAKGEYVGGVIAPGPVMAAESLAQKTAKLPHLDHLKKPRRVIGRTTRESINAGLYFGYAGLIDGLLKRLARELGGRPRVLATGGQAALLAGAVGAIHRVVPDLTMDGLRLIWNHGRG